MTYQVANPTDDDLDFYVKNIVLDSIIQFEGDLIITGKDGEGWWLQPNGEPCNAHDIEFQATVGSRADGYIDAIVVQLNKWCDNQTPVHVASSPGKLTSMTDGHTTVPLPRNEWSP